MNPVPAEPLEEVIAERLIQFNNKVPLLVSRPKGKNAGVLDYLVEI